MIELLQRIWNWLLARPQEVDAAPAVPRVPLTPHAHEDSADLAAVSSAGPAAKKPGSYGLEAANYLPISRDQVVEAAKGKSLFGNLWFGRRDLIPPADDLRTQLIDRLLVTHGLLSPEQLAEIHAVGFEMDRLRPTAISIEHQVGKTVEAVEQAEREELARIKARKKAESAERKRIKAEAIAARKAGDITFLGRGVSGRLGERTSETAQLDAAGLPILSTPPDLADALKLPLPVLRWLAFHAEVATRTHYVRFKIPKKSGGERTLSVPHRRLARAQRWIFEQILAKLPCEEAAHGFIPGRSILTNASPHCGQGLVINLDLERFFPSIGFPRVRKVFERLGYSPAISTIFALLCTECPRRTVNFEGTTYHVATGPRGLPQGACTSPGLSNQVARRLDRRLTGLALKLGLTYTRYADDLTFSGSLELEPRVGYVLARVRHIATAEGFVVNEQKTRVLRRNQAQTVTGLVVNDRPGVAREDVRRLRAILHRARSEGLERQNREGRADISAWLRGKIAFVRMVRPEVGDRLLAELEAIEKRKPAT